MSIYLLPAPLRGALVALAACFACAHGAPAWPEASAASPLALAAAHEIVADDARVTRQPVCVAARAWSAGTLGDTVLYRPRRVGLRLFVGYFVYWSTERPWGANAATFSLLPALATDAFYSHFLYVFPGMKDVLYGAGDVEGATVEFEDRADGSLAVVGGFADDGHHAPVRLTRDDLLDRHGRVVLLTEVWSHQLGAHGAARFADAPDHDVQCYDGSALRPLTFEVARAFRLGDEHRPLRAGPAWTTPPGTTGGAAAQASVVQ